MRETFCNPMDLAVINQYAKCAMMLITTVLRTVTMLLLEGSSETRVFRDFSDHVFGGRNLGNPKSMRVIFFFVILKSYSWFQKCSTKLRKKIFFRDNLIWTYIVQLSLLRTRYVSLAANVLTSSAKIRHVNKRDVFQLSWLGSDRWVS